MSNWVCRREWDTRIWEDTRLCSHPYQCISSGHYTCAISLFIVTWTQFLMKFAATAIQLDTYESWYKIINNKDIILTGMLTGRGKNESMKEKPLPAHSKIPGTPKVRSTIMPCSLAEPVSVISHNNFAAPVCGPADSSFVWHWGVISRNFCLPVKTVSSLFTSIQDAFLSFYGVFINCFFYSFHCKGDAPSIHCTTDRTMRLDAILGTQWIIIQWQRATVLSSLPSSYLYCFFVAQMQ